MSSTSPGFADARSQPSQRGRLQQQRATAALVALLGFLVALALVATPGTARASQAANGTQAGAAMTAAELQATCDYMAKEAVNVHVRPDRSSGIIRSYPRGHRFTNASCGNTTGGNYASCGGGNLWKPLAGGWVATKCLVRL
ncbi:hypothetical protein [Actinomadura sp. 9N407]|uniref:hypothetical protein n=1 Tax=Actinomadura sp. 9N407 TaxID=3375154 RepID=UPI0037B867D1